MSRHVFVLALALPFLLSVTRCTPSEPKLQWFFTCGDPVCNGYTGPTDGVALCDKEEAGSSCTDEGAACDPEDDCNALLTCAAEDPTAQEGGCPISRRAYKHDIRYLNEAERDAAGAQALQLHLATWAYNHAPPGERAHLGFIIDDLDAGSPAVSVDGDHVDLYGYTSMAVAAVQAQDKRLRDDEARIAQLERELAELRARLDER